MAFKVEINVFQFCYLHHTMHAITIPLVQLLVTEIQINGQLLWEKDKLIL